MVGWWVEETWRYRRCCRCQTARRHERKMRVWQATMRCRGYRRCPPLAREEEEGPARVVATATLPIQ